MISVQLAAYKMAVYKDWILIKWYSNEVKYSNKAFNKLLVIIIKSNKATIHSIKYIHDVKSGTRNDCCK